MLTFMEINFEKKNKSALLYLLFEIVYTLNHAL